MLQSSPDSSEKRLRQGARFCYWKHWQDAYEWDRRDNTTLVYLKLTAEHVYVTAEGKMRNHYATDALNEEMLNLMQVSTTVY